MLLMRKHKYGTLTHNHQVHKLLMIYPNEFFFVPVTFTRSNNIRNLHQGFRENKSQAHLRVLHTRPTSFLAATSGSRWTYWMENNKFFFCEWMQINCLCTTETVGEDSILSKHLCETLPSCVQHGTKYFAWNTEQSTVYFGVRKVLKGFHVCSSRRDADACVTGTNRGMDGKVKFDGEFVHYELNEVNPKSSWIHDVRWIRIYVWFQFLCPFRLSQTKLLIMNAKCQ